MFGVSIWPPQSMTECDKCKPTIQALAGNHLPPSTLLTAGIVKLDELFHLAKTTSFLYQRQLSPGLEDFVHLYWLRSGIAMSRIKLLKAILFFCEARANAECNHLFEGRKIKHRWTEKLTGLLYVYCFCSPKSHYLSPLLIWRLRSRYCP